MKSMARPPLSPRPPELAVDSATAPRVRNVSRPAKTAQSSLSWIGGRTHTPLKLTLATGCSWPTAESSARLELSRIVEELLFANAIARPTLMSQLLELDWTPAALDVVGFPAKNNGVSFNQERANAPRRHVGDGGLGSGLVCQERRLADSRRCLVLLHRRILCVELVKRGQSLADFHKLNESLHCLTCRHAKHCPPNSGHQCCSEAAVRDSPLVAGYRPLARG